MTNLKIPIIVGIIIAVGMAGVLSFGQIGHLNAAQGQVTGGGGTSMNVTVTNTPDQPVPVTVSNNPLQVSISGTKLPTLSTVCPAGDLQNWDKIIYKVIRQPARVRYLSSIPGNSDLISGQTYEAIIQASTNPGDSLENQVATFLNGQGYATNALGSFQPIMGGEIVIGQVDYAIACSAALTSATSSK